MDPGPLGTLGVGPSYAMAARLARPDEPVFIIYGDGSFGLNGMEYEAAARQKIPFIGVMGNDAAWMQIRRGQRDMFGDERSVATALDYTRYDKMVEALGGHGVGRADAEGAQGAWVHPAAPGVGGDELGRRAHDVAAVTHHRGGLGDGV